MKKRFIILFYILVTTLVSTECLSQQTTKIPTFKGAKSFGEYLQWQLNSNSCATSSFCDQFVSAMEFKLDQEGGVIINSIKIADNVQGCLKSELRNIILSTHGQWSPMYLNNEAIESSSLFQVIYFRLDGGCTINEKYRPKDNLLDTFKNAFDFPKNDEVIQEPVIILSPATVYVPTGTTDLGDYLKKEKN